MGITLDEAKNMVSRDNLNKLHEIVETKPSVDTSHKVNNDIIMAAFCKAVCEGVIKQSSLNDRLIKLLNSETNTISQSKLGELLKVVRTKQPNLICRIVLREPDMRDMMTWTFDDDVCFLGMFDYVLHQFNITPTEIRQKMVTTLKPTIVNNVSQLVSKYNKSTDEERQRMVISISTIQRLVNMSGRILLAEFVEEQE